MNPTKLPMCLSCFSRTTNNKSENNDTPATISPIKPKLNVLFNGLNRYSHMNTNNKIVFMVISTIVFFDIFIFLILNCCLIKYKLVRRIRHPGRRVYCEFHEFSSSCASRCYIIIFQTGPS